MYTDEQIIRMYLDRNPDAIQETDRQYGKKLHNLSFRLLFSHEDAKECVNDTYLGTWKAIPPTKPVYFFAFLAKLCRNISCTRLDRKTAAKRNVQLVELTDELADCIPSGLSEREQESRELAALLNDFLRSLPEETRGMFLRRYWYAESVSEIAGRFACGESRVKVSLFRTRQKLRAYLEQEGISV